MERAKQVHAQVDERHQRHAADAEHGGIAGARPRVPDGPAQQQVAYIKEKEEQRGGEARVPGPPRAPHRLPPDRSGGQHDRGEHRADLGRCLGEAVEAGILQEKEHHARHAHEHHRQLGPHRPPPTRGETKTGSTTPGNHSSERRGPTTRARNSVPRPTTPTAAGAMTPTSAPPPGPPATLKNNTNRGRPAVPPTATNTRLAAS